MAVSRPALVIGATDVDRAAEGGDGSSRDSDRGGTGKSNAGSSGGCRTSAFTSDNARKRPSE